MRKKQKNKPKVQLSKLHVLLMLTAVILLSCITAKFAINQITASTVSLKVDKPITYNDGTYPFLPGTGRHYIIVSVHVLNNTPKIIHFAPVIQTYLTDEAGNRYDMAPSMPENPIQAGPLAPGETRSGQLSYNVPTDAKGIIMHYTPDQESSEIRVAL